MDDEVGQLIWAFIESRHDLEPVAQAVKQGRIGGIWLLPTEMRTATETASLINWFQALAPVPLLVGVDAEAGLGLVMGGATQLPTAMALGAADDIELTHQAADVTAAEMAACGINAAAAPVLDVNINPANPIINTRAFGSDATLVARHGLAFMEGLQQPRTAGNRVIAIGKHFPGHGDTMQDSHLRLEMVSASRERLEAVELSPFRAAIDAGIPMLMTSHVAYPALDPTGLPATLSRPILVDLLRRQLGFNGVVVTDCMNMHAVLHNFDPEEAAVRSVAAGCDLVMTDRWQLAYEVLRQALADGSLEQSRAAEAAARIRRVKALIFGARMETPASTQPETAQISVGKPEYAEVAERIAAASLTLVDGQLIPPSRKPLIIATRMARRFGPAVEVQLRGALTSVGWPQAEVMMVDPMPDAGQIETARERAQAAGWVALLHFNRVQSFDPEAVLASDELFDLAAALASSGSPLTVVSMGSPYGLPAFSSASARLCSYSTCDASLHATLRVLSGQAQAPGVLPTSMTGLKPMVAA